VNSDADKVVDIATIRIASAGAVIFFVPVFAWLWVWLAKRNLNPSTPVKLALGLMFMGFGFVVMMGGSMVIVAGSKALPTWLVATYVFNTFGEICLYPIGLSAVSVLAPKKLLGQMMGVWFMSLALGNLSAGMFGGEFDDAAITANPPRSLSRSALAPMNWLCAMILRSWWISVGVNILDDFR